MSIEVWRERMGSGSGGDAVKWRWAMAPLAAVLLVCRGILRMRRRALSVVACLAAMGGTAYGAEHIILDSNSARYVAGATIDAASPIVLGEREFVLLATEEGRLHRIAGPHSGPASGEAPAAGAVRRAIAQFLGAAPLESEALAAVRGDPREEIASVADTRPDLWLLHADRTGEQCIVAGSPPQFWREQADEAARAEIVDLASGETAILHWAEHETTAPWPFSASPVDNRIYLIRPEHEPRSIAIRVRALAPALSDGGLASVSWLAARGCADQAWRLLRAAMGSDHEAGGP